jgi:glycerol-3-phosphate dehydrogenase
VKRDLDRLREPFDLIVIGAGIYGAAIAWDATLRGLRVALIDRGDIGGGTSFNNAKTLHGGVRSLQALRIGELREYVRERRALLRIAPHLVRPLTFVAPALGTITRNRLAYTAYFRAYDLLARDRNEGVDHALHLGGTRILGREAYLALDPLSDPARVSGGVAWQDGQMIHGERVTLAFAKAAATRGAVIATYLRADTALVDGGRVRGVRCLDAAPQPDVVSSAAAVERAIDVTAPLVVNATGPQGDRVAARLLGRTVPPLVPVLSLALNVVTRSLGLDAAVGGMARGRLFFAAPWRGVTIAGTSHEPYDGTADSPVVPPADVDTFLRDFNLAFPRAGLTRADIRLVHRGLLPTAAVVDGEVRLLKTSVIRDHADDGRPGLMSVVGTRYTTARHTAQLAVDRVFAALGRPVGGGEQRGGADEQEIPAHAVEAEGDAEVPFGDAHQGDHDAGHQERDPRHHHLEHAVTGDQMAGEESRHEHAHDMDEDRDRRLGLAQAAHDDGKRRGRHHERHHAEGDDGAGTGDHVGRLSDDLEQRPLWTGRVFRFHGGKLDEAQHDERQQREREKQGGGGQQRKTGQ